MGDHAGQKLEMDVLDQSVFFRDTEQASRLQAEADFGMREIQPFLDGQPDTASVLEIGCGTGYLLVKLAEKFERVSLAGVEPIGPGFTQFSDTLDAIEEKYKNLVIHRNRVEDLQTDQKYDLIYSINVFEHLEDWRLAVDKCVSLLKPKGQLVILCPNYWIPYESHFALPIVWNKSLTYKLFSRRIDQLESSIDAEGLWSSLNFITAPEVKRHCIDNGYKYAFDKDIMRRMFERLEEDPDFKFRQAKLAKIAGLASHFGAGKLLGSLPARFGAYMKIVVYAR